MTRSRDALLLAVFSKVLKRLREEGGYSQEQLGFVAGVDRTFVTKLESGKSQPSLSVLFALADALGRSPHDLVREVSEAYRASAPAPVVDL